MDKTISSSNTNNTQTGANLTKLGSIAKSIASKHTSVPVRDIHVVVSVDGLKAFNQAFVREGERKNPLMAEKVNLTAQELEYYEKFLLKNRVDIVNGECRIFRNLKRLSIPCFVERVLSDVGRVQIRDRGLDIHPIVSDDVANFHFTLEQAIEISNKIESFYDDLAVVIGAMPGDEEGNPETMTLALIEGYVTGMGDYDDPLIQYIVYALQSMCQETEFNCLYYMRYDDVKTIEANISALGRSLVI